MNILDLLWNEEKKVTREYEEGLQEATRRFLQQKNAIMEIKDTAGLKEIKRWFEKEKELALKAVMASKEDRDKEKARYEMADKFLQFIDNLTRG